MSAAAFAALLLAVSGQAVPLRAEELTLELWSRFRIDAETILATEDPADDLTQVRPRYTGVGALSWGAWSLNAAVEVRTTNSPAPGDDRYFEDIGVWAEELYLAYAGDGWQVYAGKFNPRFGQAFDSAPGLYGDEFAKDYEIEEQIGAGAVVRVAEESRLLGTAEISANLFMADRSILSSSGFEERDRLRLEDGGPANSERPQSFTVTLDGWDPGALPGLSYNLGLVVRSAGEGDEEDELGAVFGLVQKIPLAEGLELELMGEVARFVSFEGGGDDATYLTAGAELDVEGWRIAVAGGAILQDRHGATDRTDTLLTLNLRRDWKLGPGRLRAEAGWALIDDRAVEGHVLGFRIDYRIPLTLVF